MKPQFLTSRLIIQYDDDKQSVLVLHPDTKTYPQPLIDIRSDTLARMKFTEASEFIGERMIMLIPQLREMFADYLWTEDGQPPKKP